MEVMNLAEVMDRSVEILKKYVKSIIMFSVGYGVIMFFGLFIIMMIGVILIAVSQIVLKNIILIIILASLLCFVVISISITANVGIIKITSQEFFEEKIYASTAVGGSLKSIFKVFGISGIALLLFIPVLGIFSVPIYLIYKNFQSLSRFLHGNYIGIVVSIVIGILLILAGIAVIIAYMTMFAFSMQVLTIENKGVMTSIKRSFNLVKHDFWKIYGCLILFGLTIYAIRYSLMSFWALAISIVFMILKALNFQESYTTFLTMAITYSNWPISLISWCLISPIGTIMISLLYFNQRFKKEGYDIQLRLKEIQKIQERETLNDNA